MPSNTSKLQYDVTWLVRRLFRAMGKAADQYLADSGITAADRAVLEFLFPDRQLSVPDIAARYQVSRQHVQATVNSLLKKGLVETAPNPRHRRSRLVLLHELGRATFVEIRRNEAALIEQLFADIPAKNLQTTHDTLNTIYRRLDQENES